MCNINKSQPLSGAISSAALGGHLLQDSKIEAAVEGIGFFRRDAGKQVASVGRLPTHTAPNGIKWRNRCSAVLCLDLSGAHAFKAYWSIYTVPGMADGPAGGLDSGCEPSKYWLWLLAGHGLTRVSSKWEEPVEGREREKETEEAGIRLYKQCSWSETCSEREAGGRERNASAEALQKCLCQGVWPPAPSALLSETSQMSRCLCQNRWPLPSEAIKQHLMPVREVVTLHYSES